MRKYLLHILLVWLGFLMIPESHAQCANDNISIGTLSPTGAGYSQSVIILGGYSVVVNVCAGASYVFSTCGDTSFDSQITVYNQSNGAQVGYSDDACGLQSSVSWTSNFNGSVSVVVDQFYCSGSAAYINLTIQQTSACSSTSTANDLCPNATPIACGQTLTGSTGAATADTYPAGCGFGSSPGVWYTFTGNGQASTVSLCGSVFDTQLSVFTGTCTALSCVATNDDFCGVQSQVSFNTVAGVVYRILVFGFGSSSGSFVLSLSCATTPSGSNQNCSTALPICTDTQFGGNSSGAGSVLDLNASNQGCLSVEHQASWYVFQPTTTGTISFTINPTPPVDYDFAVWGPFSSFTCPLNTPPLRCSWSALSVPTGLGNGATDWSEGAGGNAWVAPITVGPADVNDYYIMLLDNFVASSTPFVFDWSLSGVILNCNIQLPVELTGFSGKAGPEGNQLFWSTASEVNNDRFEIERSNDAVNFVKMGVVPGNGTSNYVHHYAFVDISPSWGIDYYRLKQIDHNGQFEYSEVIAIENMSEGKIHPNPVSDIFKITLGSEISKMGGRLLIADSQGRITRSVEIPGGSSNLFGVDVHDLRQGVYHVMLLNHIGIQLGTMRLLVD